MPTLLRHLPFALGFAALATVWLHAQAPVYDLILRNGRVVDGAGNPWFRADVAIAGDTIARVAPAIDGRAAREIDVGGQVVAPGFIDIHTHARRGIDQNPTAPNYVRQGVTTLMEGPDGSSPVPLAPFLAAEVSQHRQLHRPGLDSIRGHRPSGSPGHR
jgi:dihydroorotase/N-acyl-D-amino-acid deacylase